MAWQPEGSFKMIVGYSKLPVWNFMSELSKILKSDVISEGVPELSTITTMPADKRRLGFVRRLWPMTCIISQPEIRNQLEICLVGENDTQSRIQNLLRYLCIYGPVIQDHKSWGSDARGDEVATRRSLGWMHLNSIDKEHRQLLLIALISIWNALKTSKVAKKMIN